MVTWWMVVSGIVVSAAWLTLMIVTILRIRRGEGCPGMWLRLAGLSVIMLRGVLTMLLGFSLTSQGKATYILVYHVGSVVSACGFLLLALGEVLLYTQGRRLTSPPLPQESPSPWAQEPAVQRPMPPSPPQSR